MPELDILAERIKAIRRERHESQVVFAQNCGISTEELSLIERRRTDPKLSTLQNIAAYVGESVSDLLSVEIRYTYTLIADQIEDQSGEVCTVYGVELWEDRRYVCVVNDIFFDREKATEFVSLCNQLQLSAVHLMCVIADVIESGFYT